MTVASRARTLLPHADSGYERAKDSAMPVANPRSSGNASQPAAPRSTTQDFILLEASKTKLSRTCFTRLPRTPQIRQPKYSTFSHNPFCQLHQLPLSLLSTPLSHSGRLALVYGEPISRIPALIAESKRVNAFRPKRKLRSAR